MMINLTTIIFTLAGIILTAVITGLIFNSKSSALKTKLETANQQLEEEKSEGDAKIKELKDEYEQRMAEMKANEELHFKEAMLAKDKAHEDTINTLKENFESSLQAKDEAHKKNIETLEKNFKSTLSVQETASKEAITSLREDHEKSIKEQQERFDATMQRIATENKAATEELLKARQKEFAETSSSNIGQIVTPLKESIAKMEEVMQKSSKETISINSALQENLKQMIEQSKATQNTTEELTKAFKHKSKVQGDWGETVLTELLESQGLTEGVHFELQATIRDSKGNVVKNEEGSRMRPDVILHLDKVREVIIDAKVSLTAFFDYVNAEDDGQRKQYLDAHVRSIQQHVNELAKKDYSNYIQAPKVKMDYVIMFVPHTGALWTALNAQPDLWRKAMEQHVFIADEQSLYATLQIIRMTWTQIKQAQNHEEVYKLASDMVDRVGIFVKKYEEVGNALKKAQSAYDDGHKKLMDKGKSIVLSANNLIKLGAKQSQSNPVPELMDIEEIEPLELPEEAGEK